jgi:hypothetical protein
MEATKVARARKQDAGKSANQQNPEGTLARYNKTLPHHGGRAAKNSRSRPKEFRPVSDSLPQRVDQAGSWERAEKSAQEASGPHRYRKKTTTISFFFPSCHRPRGTFTCSS